jgi:hypothetical protein
MKLGFTIGSIPITIIDTDTSPTNDASDLTDQQIAALCNPCLSGEQRWEPESQYAFEEAVHRGLMDYETGLVEAVAEEDESRPWWKL